MYKEEKEYIKNFGHLPDTQDELIKYIENNFKLNQNKINTAIDHIQSISWIPINEKIMLEPTPAARPKINRFTKTFYVKGAKRNKEMISKFISDHHIISTATRFNIMCYQRTPTASMTNTEIYLAEMGMIRPTVLPDWDNIGKTYSDALQDILLINDNIIIDGRVQMFWSLKPRVIIEIEYQDKFDCKYNERRMKESVAYKRLNNKEEN